MPKDPNSRNSLVCSTVLSFPRRGNCGDRDYKTQPRDKLPPSHVPPPGPRLWNEELITFSFVRATQQPSRCVTSHPVRATKTATRVASSHRSCSPEQTELSGRMSALRRQSKTEVCPLARHVRSTLRSRHRQATRSGPVRAVRDILQNTAHYSIVRSTMSPRPLSASNRRGIVRLGDQHYPGGHRSWT